MRSDYIERPHKSNQTFLVLYSAGAEGQKYIEAFPDSRWEYTRGGVPPVLKKAGHLLVAMYQDASTARLVAVASHKKYVGAAWQPVTGLSPTQSQALAVFINSTTGRLMIMKKLGKKLAYPSYNPASWLEVGIPDIDDPHIVGVLADCWEATRYEIVPQYRDGYTPIRQTWDEAVAKALNWNIEELNELGELLAKEPHVRGIGYNQWKE